MFQEFEKQNKATWQAKAENDFKGKALSKLNWQTFEGEEIEPYLTNEDLDSYALKALMPGQFPFVRSQKELSNGWLVREEIREFKNFKTTNKKALNAIENGAHNLVFAIKAQQNGFDGIPVKNLENLASLLDGIDTQQTGISFKSGNASPFYLKLLAQWATKNGLESSQIFGGIDFDPISAYLTEGYTAKDFDSTFGHLAEITQFGSQHFKHYKTLTIHSSPFHNAGASIVQELAFTLSAANEYLHQFEQRGLHLDQIHNQLQIELCVGGSYFQEIAKIRAWRWLWATLTAQYSKNAEANTCYLIAKTSDWNKAVYDPHVNLLRVTTEGMAAAIGSADEIEINPYDKGFRPTNEFSERIARNLHHLLMHETHLDKSVDPAAGSYYIENLTQSIATNAWELFKKIEEKGGLLAVAKSAWLNSQLKSSRKLREDRLAKRKDKFIGVNEFPNPADKVMDLLQEDKEQVPYISEVEAESDFEKMTDVKQYADTFLNGTTESCEPIESYMATESFEQLRASVEMAEKEGEKTVSFFIMPLGNKSMRTARANFALNLYQCGGFKVINNAGFETVDQAIEAFKNSKADVVIICSSDDEYPKLIPQIGKALKKIGKLPKLVLAGHPGNMQEDYQDMGIEEFIYMGCNVYEILKGYVRL